MDDTNLLLLAPNTTLQCRAPCALLQRQALRPCKQHPTCVRITWLSPTKPHVAAPYADWPSTVLPCVHRHLQVNSEVLRELLGVVEACWLGHAGAAEEADAGGGAALAEAAFVVQLLDALTGRPHGGQTECYEQGTLTPAIAYNTAAPKTCKMTLLLA